MSYRSSPSFAVGGVPDPRPVLKTRTFQWPVGGPEAEQQIVDHFNFYATARCTRVLGCTSFNCVYPGCLAR